MNRKKKHYYESMGIAGLYGFPLQENAGRLINEWGV